MYAYLATDRPSLLFLEGENTAKAVHQRQIMQTGGWVYPLLSMHTLGKISDFPFPAPPGGKEHET
jgi:hypothetical protein